VDDLLARVSAAIEKRERVAQAVKDNSAPWDGQWRADGTRAVRTYNGWVLLYGREGQPLADGLVKFIADNDPASVLRGCAADRKLIAEVQSWKHFYLDEDNWFSCGLAVDSNEPDGEPGSGCANDTKAGDHCDCGLEARQLRILRPLAERYEVQQ
jgi:hypothetical protein